MSSCGIEWGAVSDWVSGIGSLLAVVVALVLPLRANRDQERARLASIFAWAETSSPVQGSLWLINNTDSPIYDWKATITWSDRDGAVAELSTSSADHGLLPPGRHNFEFTGGAHVLPANDAQLSVRLSFTDAAGRRLVRRSTGELKDDAT